MWRVDRLSAHHRCDVILSAAEGETRRMSLPLRRIAPILLMSLVAAIAAPLTATAAGASPIDDKKAEAARLAAAIEANGEKTTALDEQMNGAQIQLQDAQTQIATAKQGIDQAQQQADSLKAALGQRAASIYTDQTSPGANADSLADPITAAARSTYAAAAANKNDGMISQLTVVKEQLAQKKAEYEAARAAAKTQTDQLAATRTQVATLNANQTKLLAQTKGELATLVAADQKRRDDAARAAALAAIQRAATRRASSGTASRGGGAVSNAANTVMPTDLPAPSPRAAQAIAFARDQLGKPYVYAATGPDSYDCSGLTMRAWGAAGVSMAHYSGAQYAAFPHVPLDQLQPGDLVFRGAGGSAHVALYIGGGLVITAPQTGDHVKVAGMGNVMGASRPG
jgi:cell wall-associated NlpC family hydrolase